ncbi:hypothetical protein [Crocosphaera sp.]|uniref:hypothetical protein n=1 Tax=Crocosphaera sp. TaxID=2729996 RepID=UPI003F2283B4|nr:hypothetical protein [Crocosphaera sp.]
MKVIKKRIAKAIACFPERLLDYRKSRDYLYLFFIGIFPIIFSFFIGLNNSIHLTLQGEDETIVYKGYWLSWNWIIYPLILPLSLCLLRKITNKLFGLPCKYNKYYRPVPLLMLYQQNENEYPFTLFGKLSKLLKTLYENQEGKTITELIEEKLRQIALNKYQYFLIFFIDIFIHVVGRFKTIEIYLSYYQNPGQYAPDKLYRELDWEIFFTISNFARKYSLQIPQDYRHVDINFNLLFSISCYLNQFLIFFISLTAIVLSFRFNYFYLSRIYIRSNVYKQKDVRKYIVLNFEDKDFRFGLSKLDDIFDLQITILIIAGVFLLVSRYANIPSEYYSLGGIVTQLFENKKNLIGLKDIFNELEIVHFFPDTGQVVIAITWLLGFLVVCMPACVKFLPLGLLRNPIILLKNLLKGMKCTDYLKEFIPPEKEKNHYKLSAPDNVKWVTKKFKEQSFWPIGDENAVRLLFFVFVVFYVLLIPLKLNISKFGDFFDITLVLFLAGFTSWILLKVFKILLGSYLKVPQK